MSVSAAAACARAPGRVNLIGEHTDHEDGLALPFAIAPGVTVRATPAGGGFDVRADDLGEHDAFAPGEEAGGAGEGWRSLVRGLVAELRAAGYVVPPARIVIAGDLPHGAGLASSAALGAALGLALLGLAGEAEPDRVALARLLQRVENRWMGAQTGLLDQLAVLCAPPDGALRIDFQALDLRPVPVDLHGASLAILDSGAPRALAGSGYNARRAECRRAAELLGVPTLREASPDDVSRLPAPLDRRLRHVLTENARVEDAISALAAGDLAVLGHLLDASHASLRDDFEVSVPAVEATVAAARAAGALGARIHGGGFGGGVLALFPPGVPPPAPALVVSPSPPAALA